MKKNKSSKNWINKQKNDQFVKKSKIFGYRSRSAFKLIELNKKFKILKKNTKLIDLGSSPGGWSQVASKIVTNGQIFSVDKKKMDEINNVKFYKGDFLDENCKNLILQNFHGKADVILSDMAADTTGNSSLDCIRTNLLCKEVIIFSKSLLKAEGILVSKLFMGQDFIEAKNLAKSNFKNVIFFKPISSRSFSKETYLHCKGLKAL